MEFLECVNRCQAERKPENEDQKDVENPGENPPAASESYYMPL